MLISLMRKGLVFTIIVLFVGSYIIPSTATIAEEKTILPTFNGKTLYVGGYGPNNYTKIQDAIYDAEDRDTVFVFDDSSPYVENLVVDKSVNLVGEDKETTIIEGVDGGKYPRHVIHVAADSVVINGFTIQNGVYGNHNDGGIGVSSDYNTISENNIRNNMCGISAKHSCHNHIIDNNITENKYDGIHLLSSSDNEIIGNNIENNDIGIFLLGMHRLWFLPESKNNKIMDNTIKYNEYHGIYLGWSSSKSRISGNSIIQSEYGIGLWYSHDNTITRNNLLESNITNAFFKGWKNTWDGNYWNEPLFAPKSIFGYIVIGLGYQKIPWLNFDWHPAREPYDIPQYGEVEKCKER